MPSLLILHFIIIIISSSSSSIIIIKFIQLLFADEHLSAKIMLFKAENFRFHYFWVLNKVQN